MDFRATSKQYGCSIEASCPLGIATQFQNITKTNNQKEGRQNHVYHSSGSKQKDGRDPEPQEIKGRRQKPISQHLSGK